MAVSMATVIIIPESRPSHKLLPPYIHALHREKHNTIMNPKFPSAMFIVIMLRVAQ